jgi:glutaryl-CoA dehydrogenase
MEGIIAQEIARVDVSISTFFGVHSGLAMGSIYLCGSEEQKQEWLPKCKNWKLLVLLALPNPMWEAGVAGGMETTCKFDGENWMLNGQKKWIGNATFADVIVIWARDEDSNQVKGFLVRAKENPGFKAEKMEDKMALRIVQNAIITLTDCVVRKATG